MLVTSSAVNKLRGIKGYDLFAVAVVDDDEKRHMNHVFIHSCLYLLPVSSAYRDFSMSGMRCCVFTFYTSK